MTSVGIMASAVVLAASTFPVIATVNTATGASLTTSTAIPAPSGITAGNLLVANISQDRGTTALSASTGWTQLAQVLQGTTNASRWACFVRIADGGANDALAVTGDNRNYCASILRITGHAVTTIATDIKFATTFDAGSSAQPDPPPLDAGSSRKWLWLCVAAQDSLAGSSLNVQPTSYTKAHANLSAGTSNASEMGIATRNLEAQTDNPVAWTSGGTRPYIAATIAIPPA